MPTPEISDITPIERKIGSTTYTVTAGYSQTSKETAIDKVHRLLLQNSKVA